MLPLRSCFCPRGVRSSSLNRSTAFALCRRGCRSCHFGTMVRTPIYSIFSRAILAIFVTFVSHPVFHAVGRFARFFITSMSGLVVGLLSPFSLCCSSWSACSFSCWSCCSPCSCVACSARRSPRPPARPRSDNARARQDDAILQACCLDTGLVRKRGSTPFQTSIPSSNRRGERAQRASEA